eukprot:546617-Pelagomonas_calceolata.AAC.3
MPGCKPTCTHARICGHPAHKRAQTLPEYEATLLHHVPASFASHSALAAAAPRSLKTARQAAAPLAHLPAPPAAHAAAAAPVAAAAAVYAEANLAASPLQQYSCCQEAMAANAQPHLLHARLARAAAAVAAAGLWPWAHYGVRQPESRLLVAPGAPPAARAPHAVGRRGYHARVGVAQHHQSQPSVVDAAAAAARLCRELHAPAAMVAQERVRWWAARAGAGAQHGRGSAACWWSAVLAALPGLQAHLAAPPACAAARAAHAVVIPASCTAIPEGAGSPSLLSS